MSQFQNEAARAVAAFVAEVSARAPCRVEAKVESANGMPLLCAVEDVLRGALPRGGVTHELVWLTGAPKAGGEVLSLKAFGAGGVVVGEAVVRGG